jgi:hypothetical protein
LHDFAQGKKVINIAGNRESTAPGIQEKVVDIVQEAFREREKGQELVVQPTASSVQVEEIAFPNHKGKVEQEGRNICDVTSFAVQKELQEKGLSSQIVEFPVVGVGHKAAVTRINEKLFIVDQPQREFLKRVEGAEYDWSDESHYGNEEKINVELEHRDIREVLSLVRVLGDGAIEGEYGGEKVRYLPNEGLFLFKDMSPAVVWTEDVVRPRPIPVTLEALSSNYGVSSKEAAQIIQIISQSGMEKVLSMPMQPENIQKILSGEKTTTLRREQLPEGIYGFGGKRFQVSLRSPRPMSVTEAGGVEAISQTEVFGPGGPRYEHTKRFLAGKEKLYVYDIKPELLEELRPARQQGPSGKIVFDPSSLSLEQMRDVRKTLAYWLQLAVDNSKYGLLRYVWKNRTANFSQAVGLPFELDKGAIPADTYNWANNLYPVGQAIYGRKGISGFQKALQEYHARKDIPTQTPVERMMMALSDEFILPQRDTPAYKSLEKFHTEAVSALTKGMAPMADADMRILSDFLRFKKMYLKNLRKQVVSPDWKKWLAERGYAENLSEEEYLDEGWVIRSQAGDPVRFDKALLEASKEDPASLEFQFLTVDGVRTFRQKYLSLLSETGMDWGQVGMFGLPIPWDRVREVIKKANALVIPDGTRFWNERAERFLESRLEWLRGIEAQGADVLKLHLAPEELRRLGQLRGRNVQLHPLSASERKELLTLVGLLEASYKAKDFGLLGRAISLSRDIGEMGWPIRRMVDKISDTKQRIGGLSQSMRRAMEGVAQLGMDPEKAKQFALLAMGRIQEKDLPVGMEELPGIRDALYKPRSPKKLIDKTDPDFADYPDEANTDSVMNELYSVLYKVWMKHARPALSRSLTYNENAFRYAYEMMTGSQSGVERALSSQQRRALIARWLAPERILPYEENYFPIFPKTGDTSVDVQLGKMLRAEEVMEKWRGDPSDPNAVNPLTTPSIISRMLSRKVDVWKDPKFELNAGRVLPEYAETVLAWALREEAKTAYRTALQNILKVKEWSPEQGEKLLSFSAWMESHMREVLGYNTTKFTKGGQVTRILKNGAMAALSPYSNAKNRIGGREMVFTSQGLHEAFGKYGRFERDHSLELDNLTGMTLAKLREKIEVEFEEGGTRELGPREELSERLRQKRVEQVGGSQQLERWTEESRWLAELSMRMFGKHLSYTSGEEFWRTRAALSGYIEEVALQRKAGRRPGEGKEQFIKRVRESGLRAARQEVVLVMGDFRPEMLPELMRSSNWYNLLFALRRWNLIYLRNLKKIFVDDPRRYGWDQKNLARAGRFTLITGLKVVTGGLAARGGYDVMNLVGDDVAGVIYGLYKLLRGDTEDIDETLIPSVVGGRIYGPVMNLAVALMMGDTRGIWRSAESNARLAAATIAPVLPALWPAMKNMGRVFAGEKDAFSAFFNTFNVYRIRKSRPRPYSDEWFAERRKRRIAARKRYQRRVQGEQEGRR